MDLQPTPPTISIHKRIFSPVNNRGFLLFPLQDLCKVLLCVTYLTAELYSWYLLNLACPFKWPCRYQTCNGCSHWINSNSTDTSPLKWLTGFLAVLCNHSWIFLTLEKLFILTLNAMTYQAALSSRWWERAKQFVSFLSQMWFKFKL